jgi:hypothetical protein
LVMAEVFRSSSYQYHIRSSNSNKIKPDNNKELFLAYFSLIS